MVEHAADSALEVRERRNLKSYLFVIRVNRKRIQHTNAVVRTTADPWDMSKSVTMLGISETRQKQIPGTVPELPLLQHLTLLTQSSFKDLLSSQVKCSFIPRKHQMRGMLHSVESFRNLEMRRKIISWGSEPIKLSNSPRSDFFLTLLGASWWMNPDPVAKRELCKCTEIIDSEVTNEKQVQSNQPIRTHHYASRQCP